jgi:hypothetical protein
MTIAAADTLMTQTNEELLAMAYPGCRLRPGTGPHDTLIGIDAARRLIGYEPEWTWRRILGQYGWGSSPAPAGGPVVQAAFSMAAEFRSVCGKARENRCG